jgi:muramoyltetrapeptide carboxypeptidase
VSRSLVSRPLPFPPPLRPGGTIGIIAPSRWPEPAWIEKGAALLEKRGYRVKVHPQVYKKDFQWAGSDAARAKALMDMFADSSIDAIMCARGGNGAIRIVDRLDYKLIKRHPKPFVGFSDITLLLQAIGKHCGFVTYHGPLIRHLAHPHAPGTLENLLGAISGTELSFSHRDVKILRPGSVQGRLVGGNMALLQAMIGTPHDWSAKDAVLFIEDVDVYAYMVDRMLRHFRMAGKFDGVRAVILGAMVCNADADDPYGRDVRKMLLDVLPPDIPLCMGFPCGHGLPGTKLSLTTLPVGARVKLTLDRRGAALDFSGK